jgi:hypothetical protein
MKWIVIDTSYLLELFRVPGDYDEDAHTNIKKRFEDAFDLGWHLYVPIPVVFELGNHIADVSDGGSRRRLAGQLARTIRASSETGAPWILFPQQDQAVLLGITEALDVIDNYEEAYAQQGIGLTDVHNILIAQQLKERTNRYPEPRPVVHIWTRDNALKAYEPDAEQNAFV